MPLDLDETVARADEVARKVALPLAEETDRAARWPREALRALRDAGLGGLVVPAAAGGLGHGMVAIAHVSEALGRVCASTAMCFAMHCVGSAVLSVKATPEQSRTYLEPIAEGKHLTTLGLSEPGSGAHFYLPQTRLRRVAHDFALDGEKAFVTNGGEADSYVVSTVSADPDAPPGQFSMVVVPKDAPGIGWGPPWAGIGMRGNSSRRLTFRDARIPSSSLLGSEGDQIWYVFEVVTPVFLVGMAGTYLGVADATLREVRDHLAGRRYSATGGSLARDPILQHRLGALWAQVEGARALLHAAASRGDAGDAAALPMILSAKAQMADVAVTVANEALTLLGGVGYERGSSADRHLRDARAAHVMAPTTDILRTWTGRWLLDQPLLTQP